MSLNQKEEETNKANLLKEQEFQTKLEENSHIQKISTLDSNITSNKSINCSLSNEWNTATFPNFISELTIESKKNYPIDNYLSNQAEDNIFYQHPNLINDSENNIIILNSLRDLEVDLMNKWFENYECFEYYLSLYHQEIFLNEERKLDNIDKLKEKIRLNLEKEIKAISNNQTFKFNLVLLKFLLKELSNITLDNIDELFLNLNNFENYSKFLDEHYEISFLLVKEKKDLLKKINNLIDTVIESKNENKEVILGKLLLYEYNIVTGLKSLFGILTFIKKIKEIEKKGMLSNYLKDLLMNNIKNPYLINSLNEKSNELEKIEVKSEYSSYIKLSNEVFKFQNSCMTFVNDDLAYILNENKCLYKLHRLNEEKNKYNIIESNEKFLNENEDMFIFSLEKEYLFGFNYTKFGNSEEIIKLLKTEHICPDTKIEIIMDEKSKKILCESTIKSKEIINDIYLNLFSFDENEKEQFLNNYVPNSEININNLAILQYNNNLFLIHPILKKNSNPEKNTDNQNNNAYKNNDYFFSDKYIYTIDQFEIILSQDKIKIGENNFLSIDYKDSFIIKIPLEKIPSLVKQDENKKKINIDEILNTIKSKNKLIFINNYLCFTDNCKNFFDAKNKKICCFDNEPSDNILVTDIAEESKENLSNSIIAQYGNSIIDLTLIKTSTNNIQEIKEKEYKSNSNFMKNIFTKNKNVIKQIKENVNQIFLRNTNSLSENNKNDIFKEIFQTYDDNDETENTYKEAKKDINEIKEFNEDFTNYILTQSSW